MYYFFILNNILKKKDIEYYMEKNFYYKYLKYKKKYQLINDTKLATFEDRVFKGKFDKYQLIDGVKFAHGDTCIAKPKETYHEKINHVTTNDAYTENQVWSIVPLPAIKNYYAYIDNFKITRKKDNKDEILLKKYSNKYYIDDIKAKSYSGFDLWLRSTRDFEFDYFRQFSKKMYFMRNDIRLCPDNAVMGATAKLSSPVLFYNDKTDIYKDNAGNALKMIHEPFIKDCDVLIDESKIDEPKFSFSVKYKNDVFTSICELSYSDVSQYVNTLKVEQYITLKQDYLIGGKNPIFSIGPNIMSFFTKSDDCDSDCFLVEFNDGTRVINMHRETINAILLAKNTRHAGTLYAETTKCVSRFGCYFHDRKTRDKKNKQFPSIEIANFNCQNVTDKKDEPMNIYVDYSKCSTEKTIINCCVLPKRKLDKDTKLYMSYVIIASCKEIVTENNIIGACCTDFSLNAHYLGNQSCNFGSLCYINVPFDEYDTYYNKQYKHAGEKDVTKVDKKKNVFRGKDKELTMINIPNMTHKQCKLSCSNSEHCSVATHDANVKYTGNDKHLYDLATGEMEYPCNNVGHKNKPQCKLGSCTLYKINDIKELQIDKIKANFTEIPNTTVFVKSSKIQP